MRKLIVIVASLFLLGNASIAFSQSAIVKEYKATVSGTLEYARMQYFLNVKKGGSTAYSTMRRTKRTNYRVS